ncbi:MAG: hydroxyectoine utilization dehydratase EutB, partial [Proteobacteria bacterium]
MTDPAFVDIVCAARAIAGSVTRTPMISSALDAPFEILLKLETLQPSGAFKLRGATNALVRLDAGQRRRGVVCCSTGNHGRAIALAARRLGIPASVCLSELVPASKIKAVEAAGATVHRVGASQDEAQVEASRLVDEQGMTDIPPFDHPDVIAGQGTVGLEILEDRPDIANIVIPLSGGGLAAGVALAAKTINPRIRVFGVSMARGAAMATSLSVGRPVEVTEVATLADSLGGGIGAANRYTFELCRNYVDEVVLLSEQEIYGGIQALFSIDRIVAEGAAAVSHAALIHDKLDCRGATAFIISGNNVDMDQFTRVINDSPVEVGD